MVNIKSFNFAISSLLVMSLAACSSDDSTDNGGGIDINNQASGIGVVLNSTANRVTNYSALTSGAKSFTRALPTSASTNLGLSFPAVPSYTEGYFGEKELTKNVTYQSGAATFTPGTLNLNGHNLVLNHNLTLSGLQGSGNIYVQGTRTLTLDGITELPAGVKIYVNGGGKLVVTAKSFTVANGAGLYAKNAFYKSGDGEKKTMGTDGTFVGKDFTNNGEVLTQYELRANNITLGKDSKTQIGTNLYATGDLEADGALTASFLSAQASTVKGTVTVANTFNSEKSLTVNGGTLYGNFIKAGDYTKTSTDAEKFIRQENGSKIILGSNGVVETYTYYNTDANSSLELADGNLGMLLTKNLVLAGENNAFIKTCEGGKMGVYFKHAKDAKGTEYDWDDVAFSGASVLKVNHEDDFAYISLPEVKDGEGKVIFSGFNTEKKGVTEATNYMNLRQTAAVAYGTNDDVRANRSATSVAVNGTNVYVSYHTQGAGQAGMLDYLTVDANGKADLVQSLSAVNATPGTASGSNAIDWNNLLLDGDKLIGVGNSENGGVITALKLSGNKFDVAEGTSSIGSDKSPLTYCRMQSTTTDGQAGDGNAVIKVGDAYVAATTYGIETFNSDLEETYAKSLRKGKYVAKGGDKVYVSYLNNSGTMGINRYAASDTHFETPTSVASISNVTPENGKNVMVVDGNDIYVAAGANGLYKYTNGTLVATFKPADATYTVNAQDNTEKYPVGTTVTRGYCNGVAVDRSHIFLAYGSLGVIVLNKSDLTSGATNIPEVARYCAGNGSANFVAVNGNLVYVAYGKNNLQVLKLEEANNR
jgi:hypothetical protein